MATENAECFSSCDQGALVNVVSVFSHCVALRLLKLNIEVWPKSNNDQHRGSGISVRTIAEKITFFFPDDKILCDADCADMSRYGDILNSLGPIRISFAHWVYI